MAHPDRLDVHEYKMYINLILLLLQLLQFIQINADEESHICSSPSCQSLSHTTVDPILIALEKQLDNAIHPIPIHQQAPTTQQLQQTRNTIASLRSRIALNYQTLASQYKTSNHYEKFAFNDLSIQSSKYIISKQKKLSDKLDHLENNILPNGHEYNPKLLSDLARTHHQLGHLTESEMYYKRSIAVDGLANNNLANLLTEKKEWKQAITTFQAAIDRKTNAQCITRHGWNWMTPATKGVAVQTVSSSDLQSAIGRTPKRSLLVTLTNISITGKFGVMFRTSNQETTTQSTTSSTRSTRSTNCEIFLGGHRYMHHLRYERGSPQNVFVNQNIETMISKDLYINSTKNDVVLNVVQSLHNNFYHALIEIGGRLALLHTYALNAAATAVPHEPPPQKQQEDQKDPKNNKNNENKENNKDNEDNEDNEVNTPRYIFLIPNRTKILNNILSMFDPLLPPSTLFVPYLPKRNVKYNVQTLIWADWDDDPFFASERLMYKPTFKSSKMYPSDRFVPSFHALVHLRSTLAMSNYVTSQSTTAEQRKKNHESQQDSILLISRQGSKRGEIIGEEMLFHGLVNVFIPRLSFDQINDENNATMKVDASFYQIDQFFGSTLTMKEQITFFRHAIGVVGAHGAGFSNLIFARPNTVVVEIPLQPFEEGIYFSQISQALNLCYVDTNSALGIHFRYVDNVLIMNEYKINQIVHLLKRGVDEVHKNKMKCPFL